MRIQTIKNKIFFFVFILTTLSLAIVSITIYILFYQTLEKNEINHSIETSDKTKQNIEYVLKFVDKTGSLLGANKDLVAQLNKTKNTGDNQITPDNNSGEDKISIMLQTIISVQENIKGIYIVGNNGDFYSSYSGIDRKVFEENYGLLISEIESPGKYFVSTNEIKYNPIANSLVISYIRPLFDTSTEKRLGTIIIDINYDYLKELFAISSIQNDEKVLVVNNKGETVFTHPFNIILDSIIQNDPELLDMGNAVLRRDVFGQDSIIISNTIEYSDWKIIKVISTKKLYKDTTAVTTVSVIVSIVFTILALSASLILSLTLTKPILELNKKIKLIEGGDLSVNVEVNSKDELGQLSQSFNNMVLKLRELISKVVEEQRRKSDMEFQMLQTQINPHFLYNTLDSIKWLAVIQNVNNISEMTTSLISLLKYNISQNNPSVSLEEEITSVSNYVKIQKYRYGDIFDIEYHISETAKKCKVIKLLLQPIVENAIFHGFESIENNGKIIIDAKVNEDNLLIIQVSDNGSGMNEDCLNNILSSQLKITKFSGIGVKNIEDRIKLYFGEPFGISFSSVEAIGTTVTIMLPATLNDDSPQLYKRA
jgi:two-component system, sensor histidine kinase YesM